MTLEQLRAKHPRFVYQNFSWQQVADQLLVEFQFLLEPDVPFTARLTIDQVQPTTIERLGQAQLDQWVFHLGLIELFSYWKAAAPAKIVVTAGRLNKAQLAWWKNLLIKSMGEFFYTNQIDFTAPDFVELTTTQIIAGNQTDQRQIDQTANSSQPLSQPTPTYLIPVGGGKDSAVVLELMEENNLPHDILLSYPQSPAAAQIAQLSRTDRIISVIRTLDPTLLKLNQTGYLNGHTPFSARLAFESSLVSALFGHEKILLGNEFSANEGNIPYLGTTINHQYSKTFEFETSFRQYVQTYLATSSKNTPEYLSLLRPIYELQIAGLFAQYPRWQTVFRSCNRNQQDGTWCGECAKCLFVFTILYPFLDEKQLIGPIFADNLFENTKLNQLAMALLGKDEHKPFECVGTYQETLAAFQLSVVKFQRLHPDRPLPAVLKFVRETVLNQEANLDGLIQKTLCFWNDEHHLNEQLVKIVRAAKDRLCQQFEKPIS